jgi:hypothetical protein
VCAHKPVDDGGPDAPFTLSEQALGAGQVDEPGVARIDPHPPPRQRAARPAGPRAPGWGMFDGHGEGTAFALVLPVPPAGLFHRSMIRFAP